MSRVSRPGGRLALSVWRDLAFIPGYAAIAAAFERHARVGADFIRSAAAVADAGELRRLPVAGGWTDVRITVQIAPLRFPSVEEFVRRIIDIAPVAGLAELDEQVRQTITAEVAAALLAYTDDDGLVFPIEAHVASARR